MEAGMSQILSGLMISKYNFCGIFQKAWLKAIILLKVISGFKKAGIYLFDWDKILPSTDNSGNSQSLKDGKYM